MSLVQKPVKTTIEICYSDLRKQNMQALDEVNCSLVINNVKHILQKYNVGKIDINVPTSKKRIADVFFDFEINEEDKLDQITNDIKKELDDSISTINIFVENN